MDENSGKAMWIWRLLDILIPRFITEDCAVDEDVCGGCGEVHMVPVCSMREVEPEEEFDGIQAVTYLNLFGLRLFAHEAGKVRPFVNPHDGA